jgi:hypothetical protein
MRTCWSNAPSVVVRPSLAIEVRSRVPEAGKSAMEWSADLQWRLMTGSHRPNPACQAAPKLPDAASDIFHVGRLRSSRSRPPEVGHQPSIMAGSFLAS